MSYKTPLRVFNTNKVTVNTAPILPMSDEDKTFWKLFHQRRAV